MLRICTKCLRPRLAILFALSEKDIAVASTLCVVTNKFPDGNFSRPRLAVFALSYAQTKTSLRRAHIAKDSTQVLSFAICAPNRGRLRTSDLSKIILEHVQTECKKEQDEQERLAQLEEERRQMASWPSRPPSPPVPDASPDHPHQSF